MDTDWLETIAKWGAGAIGLGGVGALMRRRLSRDNTEVAKDRAEAQFVTQLMQERDRAQQQARDAQAAASAALADRQDDAAVIGRLRAENEYLIKEIARLDDELQSFKRRVARLYPITRPFAQSDYVPPELTPEPIPPPQAPSPPAPAPRPKKDPKP